MPELKKRPLATSRDNAPVAWVIHQTGSYLVGELFSGGYYRDCLKMAKAMAAQHRPTLTAIHAVRKSSSVDLERMIAHLEDVSRWASEVESEGYHTVNTHAFITLWAAQEAGIENVISEIMRTSSDAAKIAREMLAKSQYPFTDWPWSESMCLEIAQKLESKANNAMKGGGDDIAKRTKILFSWFDLDVQIDNVTAKKYNEASMVRNVMLHRYGYLNSKNVADFPELAPWVGEILPITTDRLGDYYNSITKMHSAIASAVFSSQYK